MPLVSFIDSWTVFRSGEAGDAAGVLTGDGAEASWQQGSWGHQKDNLLILVLGLGAFSLLCTWKNFVIIKPWSLGVGHL